MNKFLIPTHRSYTLSLFALLFIVVIFVILYYNLAFVRRNTISINNPSQSSPARGSTFVKELSVNHKMSKNNDVTHIQSAGIKMHNIKATLSQRPSKSNEQLSIPIINNYSIHDYTPTGTNSSTQNTKNFSLSQKSLVGKSVSDDNLTTRATLTSLPISDDNASSNIHNDSSLSIVPPASKMTNTSTNNAAIVHKTVINTHRPVSNQQSPKIFYELSKISIKKSLPQPHQPEQELKSNTNADFDSISMGIIVTANAGLDQKVKEGKKVTLRGDGSSSNSDQLNFFWNQISGKSVKLHHMDSANAKFKAPHVNKSTHLGFQLTVYDGNGYSSSDIVKVTVKSHKHNHSHKHKH